MNGTYFLNRWQTNSRPSGGYFDKRDLMEIDIYTAGGEAFNNFSVKVNRSNKEFSYGRPIYGSLSIGGVQSPQAKNYGHEIIIIGDEFKDYVTYTPRDSLVLYGYSQTSDNAGLTQNVASQDNLNPILSGINFQQYKALTEDRSPAEYIELQSHTPVLFKEVKEYFLWGRCKKSIRRKKISKRYGIMKKS